MFRDKRPKKRLRLAGPAPHTRSIHVKVRLEWTHNQERLSSEALLILDSGATGAVLSSDWVKNAQDLAFVGKIRHPLQMPVGIISQARVSIILLQWICT